MKLNLKQMVIALTLVGMNSAVIAAGTGSYEAGGGLAPGTNSNATGNAVNCGSASDHHVQCYGQDIQINSGYTTAIGSNIKGAGSSTLIGTDITAQPTTNAIGSNLTLNGQQINSHGSYITAEEGSNIYGSNIKSGMYSNSFGGNSTVGNFANNFGNSNKVEDFSSALATTNSTVTTSNMVIGGSSINTTGVFNSIVLGGESNTPLRSNEVTIANRTLGGVATATQADQATNLAQVEAADEATYQRSVNYTNNALANFNATDYSSDIAGLKNDVGGLRNEVRILSKKIDGISAMTAAQSNIIYNPYGSQYQIGVGAGFSGGSSALAFKVMGSNKNRTVMYSAGASFANGSKGSVGAGMSFNF